jgi:hypothetical protein
MANTIQTLLIITLHAPAPVGGSCSTPLPWSAAF